MTGICNAVTILPELSDKRIAKEWVDRVYAADNRNSVKYSGADMRLISMICAGLLAATPAIAQERETLGFGRLFNNDQIGDIDDRWRTASYAYSIVRGPEWEGQTPSAPGAILEYRLRSEIIAPQRLNGPLSDDRAYVGALSAGMHTHFNRGGADISGGVDLVVLGPQTGVADFQDWVHDVVDAPNVSNAMLANQVPNSFHPTALGEVAYPVRMSDTAQIRPFVQGQYGVEDILRVGVDVIIGSVGQNDLWLRDSASGHLYSGVESRGVGNSVVMGFDYGMVGDSAYFPASFGTVAEDTRLRARAGLHSRFGERISFFYGVTYLTEEYVGQSEGQLIGSLKLNLNF